MIQYSCPTTSEQEVSSIYQKIKEGRKTPTCANSIKAGHNPLRNAPHETITILRSPLERIASGFVHNLHDCRSLQKKHHLNEHGDPVTEMHSICENLQMITLQEEEETASTGGDMAGVRRLVETYAQCVGGCSSNMLSGVSCTHSPPTPYSHQIGKTLESLAFIGLTGRWEESICLWHDQLPRQQSDASYLSQLVNTRATTQHTCKENVKKVLKESLHWREVDDPDYHVYKKAVELFESRLPVHCVK